MRERIGGGRSSWGDMRVGGGGEVASEYECSMREL
tara:strand:+ start:954 stop:1058 length:105 start_codon:yes stop_codon:yes gene_type:complete